MIFRLFYVICLNLLLVSVLSSAADEVDALEDIALVNVPLPVLAGVDPNIIMILDDSGSMDSELLYDTNNGFLYWQNGRVVADGQLYNDSGGNPSQALYGYLFPIKYEQNYKGGRQFGFVLVLPPSKTYAFARSSEFNGMYYDPAVTYEPWPSYGDYGREFPPARTNNASYFEMKENPPVESNALNLFKDQNHDLYYVRTNCDQNRCQLASNSVFHEVTNNNCSNGSRVCDSGQRVEWYPATYYLSLERAYGKNVDKSQFKYTYLGSNNGLQSRTCAASDSDDYDQSIQAGSNFTSEGDKVAALAYDGTCLVEIKIKTGEQTNDLFPVSGRTLAQEKQNFANWFSYYRRRHQLLRGAMGEAFKSVEDIRLGMYWINNRPKGELVLKNFNEAKGQFLADNYAHVNTGGTPLRSALKFAGDQLKQTDGLITHSCQKSAAILFTDGYNTDFNQNVGNADKDWPFPFADDRSDTLADVAAEYYQGPLRQFYEDGKEVAGLEYFLDPACGTDAEQPWQDCQSTVHLNTYTIGLNAEGTLFGQANSDGSALYNSVMDVFEDSNFSGWPNVNATGRTQIDDLYHAAVNGRGEMFNAKKASQLEQGIKNAVDLATDKPGAGTLGAFNFQSNTTDDFIFVANFSSGNWSGELNRYNIIENDLQQKEIVQNSIVRATDQAILSLYDQRMIVTENPDSGELVPFWFDNLTSTQKADLATNPDGSLGSDTVIKERINYLRGDRSLEQGVVDAGKYRARTTVLGDIVHSNPIYVYPPRSVWNNSRSTEAIAYETFKKDNALRKPIIYVGANDGMLHAFDANTMAELFAFIPEKSYSTELTAGLHYLTDPDYEHRYYVDLSPTVYDVFMDHDKDGDSEWRTILLGGYRTGGSGFFVLDITDNYKLIADDSEASEQQAGALQPNNQLALIQDSLIWQFDHPDLGINLGKPVVAQLNNGDWVAIFNNGFNSGSGNRRGKLFIVKLNQYNNTIEPVILETTANSALSAISVIDLDGNDTHDRVYAGDLDGNLWVFDISAQEQSEWQVRKLFTTQNNQSITAAPAVTFTTDRREDGSYLLESPVIMFGTGQYLTVDDLSNTATQSFYVITDRGESDLTINNLQEQRFDQGSDDEGFRNTSTNLTSVSWFGTDLQPINSGWYINLYPGERVVSQASVFESDFVFFDSIVPSNDPCSPGGDTWLTYFEIATGKGLNALFVDWNRQGGLTSADGTMNSRKQENMIGMGTQVVDGALFLGNNRTGIPDVFGVLPANRDQGRRLGWEEILVRN